MPRDICEISEDRTGCATAYAYDASGRRLYAYDDTDNFLHGHAYQQRAQHKQVAINVGRYISSDPIGVAGGLNTFNYADVNPVMYADPRGELAFIPVLAGAGLGFAFDYLVSKWKEEHCTCKNASTFLGATDDTTLGALNGFFGRWVRKPRSGVGGGGNAGNKTSVASTWIDKWLWQNIDANKGDDEALKLLLEQKNRLRGTARAISRWLPFGSAAYGAFEVYHAFNCD